MKTLDFLWSQMKNCSYCDTLVKQILLLEGHATQEVRRRSVSVLDRTIPMIEMLVEDSWGRCSCLTILEMDLDLWGKLRHFPMNQNWYGYAEGEKILHRSPFTPERSRMEQEMYYHRVEEVSNYLVCFTQEDLLFPNGTSRTTAGVPMVSNQIPTDVPCPTVFLRSI